MLKSCAWECLCLAAFLLAAGWQLFVPPITGLSDNNDFPKVFGPAHICQAPFDNVNTWFITAYDAGPQCAWKSGFTSTEVLFLDVARGLSAPFTGWRRFDLRASAALHLAILAVAMALFLQVTRRSSPPIRFLLPPLAILIFTDVAYVAYLNSAYMDNASFVLLLLLVAIAAHAALKPAARWIAPAYAIVGVLLICSKAQHAVLGIPFAGLAVFYAFSNRGARATWLIAAAALLISSAVMPTRVPPDYRNISRYNLVFNRLAARDPSVLDRFGLDPSNRKWIGTNAFTAGSPMLDRVWVSRFVAGATFSRIAALYLRHPGIALHELNFELHDSVYTLRPSYMANYRQADGKPPHTAATRFSFWSNLRSHLLWYHPYYLLVLYALPLLAAIVYRMRGSLLPLALTLMTAGILEFAICTLADAVDTHRHLFLFQVITELLILFAAAGAGSLTYRKTTQRMTVHTNSTPAQTR